MCAFKVLVNTLNISHGHKFTGWLGRRTQVKSFKLTSQAIFMALSRNSGHKTAMKFITGYPLFWAEAGSGLPLYRGFLHSLFQVLLRLP